MEETSEASVKGVSIKWGLINALIGIGMFVVFDFMELPTDSPIRYISLLVVTILIVLAHKEFKEQGDGYMSYGQGFGIGAFFSLISSLITGVFTFLYVKYISPEYIQRALDEALVKMESMGRSDAEIEQGMKIAEMFSSPTAILIMGIVGGVFIGVVLSLIVSAITQKKRPENLVA